jgi:hypothetical protein
MNPHLGTDKQTAEALLTVLGNVNWLAVRLARGFLALHQGSSVVEAVTEAYRGGNTTRRELTQLLVQASKTGFVSVLPKRTRTGSAENPITKLFPAVITEKRFQILLDKLVADGEKSGRQLTYSDPIQQRCANRVWRASWCYGCPGPCS